MPEIRCKFVAKWSGASAGRQAPSPLFFAARGTPFLPIPRGQALFPSPKKGMERREAPGVGETPLASPGERARRAPGEGARPLGEAGCASRRSVQRRALSARRARPAFGTPHEAFFGGSGRLDYIPKRGKVKRPAIRRTPRAAARRHISPAPGSDKARARTCRKAGSKTVRARRRDGRRAKFPSPMCRARSSAQSR